MEKTEQIKFWESEFGDEYTLRNSGEWDKLYLNQWGVTRTDLNKEFIGNLNKKISILEVGCNRGNQLNLLEKAGFKNLWGIEINRKAISFAKDNKSWNIVEGSALNIPFKDQFFDIVFTSGVLIHISPNDLQKAIDEIYRIARKYIWCFEYFSQSCEMIEYRGHTNKLWKNNFIKLFLDRHPDLKIIRQKELKYTAGSNVDMMFLLEK